MAHGSVTEVSTTGHAEGRHTTSLVVLAIVFFMWGLITVLNDILIPHLKSVFAISYTEATMIQFVFFGTYFLASLPAARLLEIAGYKRTIAFGLFTTGVGAALFLPAASLPSFPLFLAGLFVLASGVTTLQVAANPYVALLGSPATASSRLNLVQAFNSLGTTVGPLLGGLLILANSASGTAEAGASISYAQRMQDALAVREPYAAIAGLLIVLGIVILVWRLPSLATQRQPDEAGGSIWQQHRLLLGLGAIFFYVGSEVAVGSFLINYIASPGVVPMTHAEAAYFVTLFWGGAMIGRFMGAGIMRRIAPAPVLGVVAMAAAALLALSMATEGWIALWAVVFVGLVNSIMFPTIFALAIEGLGSLTARGSALLVMSIVGGAIIPPIQGLAADQFGIRISFLIPLLCYGYVIVFAMFCARRPISPGIGRAPEASVH